MSFRCTETEDAVELWNILCVCCRCFFIVDTSAPMFDLNLPLYRQQLNKDVIMNIYINGKWGSYRHLPLDICATVTVPHALVNMMTPGDLSSFKWLEGNLDPDRFVSVFCLKFWTPICHLSDWWMLIMLSTFLRFNLNCLIMKLRLICIYRYRAAVYIYISVFTKTDLSCASWIHFTSQIIFL